MAILKLNGDTSGYVILQAASVAQNNVLTLPNTTDTLLTSNGSVMNSATINGSTLNNPILAGSGVITGSLTGGTLANTTLSSPTITGSWSQQNLNLVGTSALVSNGVYIPAANTVGFITNTTERMRLTSGGNLLVNGTVTPLSGNATVVISGLGTNGGGLQLAGGLAGGTAQQSLNGGGLTWNTYTGAVGSETYAERMRLDSNGNLGVGVSTLSLGGRLTVGKASVPSFTGAASGVVTVSDTSSTLNSYTAIDFTNTNQQLPLARMAMQFTNSGSYLSLGTTNSYGSGVNNRAITIDPNGNVGIGTTVPLSVLDVGGQANFKNNVTIAGNIIVNNISSITLTGTLTSSGNLTFTGTGNRITGDFSNSPIANRVMFQTSTLNGQTNIYAIPNGSSTTAAFCVSGSNDPDNAAIGQFFQVGGTTSIRSVQTGTGSYTPITFWTGGSESMRIDASGNVGIGTSSPAYKLDVAGAINTNNNLTFTGTGNRIIGDMSNTTHANRVAFQTSTVNAATSPFFIPNGTGTTASIVVANASDPTNSSFAQMVANGTTDVRFNSGILGTGTYLPMTFYTGGSERMRIDTSGNMGIGTSSPSTYGKLAVSGNMYAGDTTSTADGTITIGSNGAGSVAITRTGTGATNSAMTFSTTFVTLQERMRIDSSGNVGIGISSPAYELDVYKATSAVDYIAGRFVSDAAATGQSQTWVKFEKASTYGGAIGGYINQGVGSGLLFGTQNGSATPTERMRIDSSGNLLVGKSSQSATTAGNQLGLVGSGYNESVSTTAGGTLALWYMNRQSSAGSVIDFRQATTTVGSISVTASTTAYNTSSDYRLKDTIAPMTGALDKVALLKPCTYKWKVDGSDGQGFIAHELQSVIPLAVTGEKDAVNEDGTIKSQGVDYSKIVVHLVAAIKELKATVDAQAAEITALKVKVGT